MHAVDRFVPNYYRLEQHLRERITSGALKPGDPIPPESQLSRQFGVSRTTVRLALSRLVYDGLIERHRGRGSFVAEPRLEHSKPFLSFEEEVRARGARPGIKLLDMRTDERRMECVPIAPNQARSAEWQISARGFPGPLGRCGNADPFQSGAIDARRPRQESDPVVRKRTRRGWRATASVVGRSRYTPQIEG
jgi:DNA-binding transcriptional regulator YhcF (GntR family)